jgi:transcriptional regulator GlxA family with amidase domain
LTAKSVSPRAPFDRPDFVPLRVAVLIFDEVEVLDFAGPFEVFGVARLATGAFAFEVVTVALQPGKVLARNGLQIIPAKTATDIGPVDVFIVPGGYGTRKEMKSAAMLEFVRQKSAEAVVTLSVCTGSLILGAAGLLCRQGATTHHGAMDELRALACGIVIPNARIVDNGRIVSCSGVSAGIDGSLFVVSRLIGEDRATETARYMEYDWHYRRFDGISVVKLPDALG